MMADEWFRRGRLAHPDSPAGGSGTGLSRAPARPGYPAWVVPDPDSPVAREWDWQSELPRIYREEQITAALEGIRASERFEQLTRLVKFLPGPQSFEYGVCYGIAQTAGGRAGSFLELAKTFIKAGLREEARWIFGEPALRRSREERDRIIREVGAHSTIAEWRRYQQVSAQNGFLSRFEAGKILGELLVRVLLSAKIGAAAPELARVAKRMKTVGASSGVIAGADEEQE
jgi:hypothetical protein